MAITGIPSTRISEQFVGQRLLSQLQTDQLALFRTQQQISTGRRILQPSDDAPAALRAQGLQTLLEQKLQVRKNLDTNLSFLNASDSALSAVSGQLADIRGTALSVSDSFSSDVQRQSAAREVDEAVRQLVNAGNQQFRDRYLFGGSQTTAAPFELVDGFVRYNGNEGVLRSYSDIDVLFESTISGNQVFGALSEPVRGAADLNPAITAETKLSSLRGGLGMKLGAIQVSDGTQTRQIDFAGAETVGDVIETIEAHPPAGRAVTVRLSGNGLNIELDAAGGGNLTITEVGQGATAAQLGIYEPIGVLTGPLVGVDLNPAVTKSTQISELFGNRAEAVIASAGTGNDLVVSAVERGPELNGVAVSFVDGGPAAAGNESAVFDDVAGTLTITIAAGVTTANQVVEVINGDGTINNLFAAKLDDKEAGNSGAEPVSVAATGSLAGGSGTEFDRDSGFQIYNGGQNYTIDLSGASTIEDVLNSINASGASVLASINAAGNGIDVRSRLSGADFGIGENGGATATQLGIRSFKADTKLSSLNFGRGVTAGNGADFRITRPDGAQLDIDVSGAKSIQEVLDRINNHADNLDPATAVTARLATVGNGIELTTADTIGTTPLQVSRVNFSEAAIHLGLIPVGSDVSEPATMVGGQPAIVGRDVNLQEVEGVFTSLIKLSKGLTANNLNEVSRNIAQLDAAQLQVNFARADIGARSQSLDVQQSRLDNEQVELRDSLSKEIDVDLAEAISEFTSRQAALQASLQATAMITQLTLIDYL
ncbi:MAG: flagellar hook-associated protein FlgL [Pirellulales bacterium]